MQSVPVPQAHAAALASLPSPWAQSGTWRQSPRAAVQKKASPLKGQVASMVVARAHTGFGGGSGRGEERGVVKTMDDLFDSMDDSPGASPRPPPTSQPLQELLASDEDDESARRRRRGGRHLMALIEQQLDAELLRVVMGLAVCEPPCFAAQATGAWVR